MTSRTATDLNLLFVFEALAEHRSVTKAAYTLGLTQSSTSAALARMRTAFGDPLFVKSGTEMRPTPRADQLIGPIRSVLGTVRGEVLNSQAFDPASAQRMFTILTTDLGEATLLPGLLEGSERVAPGVNFNAISMPRHAAAESLDLGTADLAVGYYPDLQKSGMFRQLLVRIEHVCIVRKDHPTVGKHMTLSQFIELGHAVVKPEGREHVFEHFLQDQGLKRRVRLQVAHFLSLLPLISNSDLVATVPRHLATVCEHYGNIRIVKTPVNAPSIDVHQFWHRRTHNDPAHAWLRSLVHSSFCADERNCQAE